VNPAAAQALPFILACLTVAALISFTLTPLAARIATRAGAIDLPGAARRVHARPIPRGGGLAVVSAFLLVGVAALAVNDQLRLAATGTGGGKFVALFGGAVVGAAFGFLDDKVQLRARWQLGGQLLLALVAVVAGVIITFINNPVGGGLIPFSDPFAYAVTGVWVVGMINSLNFIDGLDGLSTGIALIAALTLGALSLFQVPVQPVIALMCAVLAGSLLGFLPWNFHPARIFIGTTGVFAVGYVLAVLSIMGIAKIAVALLVLGVPIIDTFWIIVRRVLQGQSPFTPDRGHFHHRLLDLGLTHRGAVLMIYAISALLALLSLVLSSANQLYTFMGIVVIGGLLLYLITRRGQESFEADSYPDRIRPRNQARPIAPKPPPPTAPRAKSDPPPASEPGRPGPVTHEAR
jgi:UDP-GlcNAc:undecaprenyl-phosphate GlcNAc-1-phosphate transferase